MAVQLRLYTRQGCHLCDDMAQALAELANELKFSVQAVDISNNAVLEQTYGSRVPVLMLADRLICEYFLDPLALKQALSEHTDD
jgi:thiol-disulfide isomerase/thioredoxin